MIHDFCDHCPGCRPCLIDLQTGQPQPPDSPVMIRVNRLWDKETTYAERKAFIDVTLHHSQKPKDIQLAHAVIEKIKAVAE